MSKRNYALGGLIAGAMMFMASACGSSGAKTINASQNGAPSNPKGAALTTVTLRMPWTMSGYMDPFNLAVQKGYYKAVGLNVKVAEGKGSVTTAETVANGIDNFGYADVSAVAPLIAKGAPLKVVAVFQQETASSFVYKPGTTLNHVSDILGHPIIHGASDNSTQLAHAVLDQAGVPWSKIDSVVVQPASYEQAFLTTNNAILLGSYNSTYQAIKTKDPGAQAKPFGDFGINVLSYGLIVTDKMIQNHPAEVRALVSASIKGWNAAVQDPQAATAATVAAFPTVDKSIELAQLKATLQLLHTPATKGKPIGWMAQSDWQQTLQIMAKYGGLTGNTDPSHYYTDEFIPNS